MSEAKHTPGPWEVGFRALDVVAPSQKGGTFKVCDIRGWGYLTGKGSGALGLPDKDAVAIQEANARLIAAAPDQYMAGTELDRLLLVIESAVRNSDPSQHAAVLAALKANRAAIAKATGA